MKFTIITLFPESFNSYIKASILGRALKKKKIAIKFLHLRDFAKDKHKTVDDRVYGGGAGMLFKFEPLFAALKKAVGEKKLKQRLESRIKNQESKKPKNSQIILLSAGGKTFTQSTVRRFVRTFNHLILICGRYEGVDARIEKFIDQKLSVGNFVLTGGELPAMIVVDAITRLIPGVVGNEESPKDESFSDADASSLEYPQYTRPEKLTVFKKGLDVPAILLSGNHGKIKEWREKERRMTERARSK